MYFLKKLFKLKGYYLIGRGGMLFFDGNNEFYIDTENYIPNNKSKSNYGVAIISKEIRYKNLNKGIEESQKKSIAVEVQSLLASDGIIATIE